MSDRVVRVDRLPPEGETYELHLDPGEADALLRGRGLDPALSVGEVGARARVFPGGDDVFVLGELRGAVVAPCCRCLEASEQVVAGEFHLTFVQDPPASPGGEMELHREDLDLEPLRDGAIDLEEVVAEQFLLRIPGHPLCREACRGLCPVCGGNRNLAPCDCGEAGPDPRFAALASLRRDDTPTK